MHLQLHDQLLRQGLQRSVVLIVGSAGTEYVTSRGDHRALADPISVAYRRRFSALPVCYMFTAVDFTVFTSLILGSHKAPMDVCSP